MRASSEHPDLTTTANERVPLGTTLGIRTDGDPNEVCATLDRAPELCTAGASSPPAS